MSEAGGVNQESSSAVPVATEKTTQTSVNQATPAERNRLASVKAKAVLVERRAQQGIQKARATIVRLAEAAKSRTSRPKALEQALKVQKESRVKRVIKDSRTKAALEAIRAGASVFIGPVDDGLAMITSLLPKDPAIMKPVEDMNINPSYRIVPR